MKHVRLSQQYSQRIQIADPCMLVLQLPRHAQSVQGGRRRKTIGTGAGIRHEVVHNDRYLELVDNLAAVGNLEACFVRGLMLVFAKRCMHDGTQCLAQAAAADHKVAAYVLGVLHYCYGEKQEAKPYIRQVEGEDEGGVAMGASRAAARPTKSVCRVAHTLFRPSVTLHGRWPQL